MFQSSRGKRKKGGLERGTLKKNSGVCMESGWGIRKDQSIPFYGGGGRKKAKHADGRGGGGKLPLS